jgi:hypothetical protein
VLLIITGVQGAVFNEINVSENRSFKEFSSLMMIDSNCANDGCLRENKVAWKWFVNWIAFTFLEKTGEVIR